MDFNSELLPLLKYHEALVSGQDTLGADMEEITVDIIRKKEEGKGIEAKDFVDLEENSFKVNFYAQEITKVASAIKALYRICLNDKFKLDVPEKYSNILNGIVGDESFDFSMCVENGSLAFKNEDLGIKIREMCENAIDPSSLDSRYEMLKSQYESFLKIRNRNGSKETDE